jgi:cellulose synthase/poly-beta-1,6-N-acetylglucosamine synthase-like glycosyltransferase
MMPRAAGPRHALQRALPAVAPVATIAAMDDDRAPPLVTVILPIRDEERRIRACLAAVLAQDYPSDRLEILAVDGRSTDATRAIVAELAAADPRLRLLDNPAGVVPTAMNVGLAAAEGEVVVRVDGHTIVAPDYVRQCVATLARTGAVNAGGPMRPAADGYWGRAAALATCSPFGVGGGAFHDETIERDDVDTVYLGAFRRDALLAVGGYDEELVRNQDDELNYRLRAAGGRIALTPAIRSTYYGRASLRALWRQYWQYGYWKVRVVQKHPESLRLRHAAPPLFALAVLVAAALRLRGGRGRHLWLGLAAPWLAGALLFAARAPRSRRDWPLLPALPVVFATLHLSYGFGALWGLVRWAGRWTNQRGSAAGRQRSPPVDRPAASVLSDGVGRR